MSEVIEKDMDGLSDLQEAVDLAKHYGQIDDVKRRLRALHPGRKAHKRNHDYRVIDCLTEVIALGWAGVFTGASPRSTSELPGMPDVRVEEPDFWPEAKAINPSWQTEPGVIYSGSVTPPEDGFWKKLDYHFSKATAQLLKQPSGAKVFFLNYMPLRERGAAASL